MSDLRDRVGRLGPDARQALASSLEERLGPPRSEPRLVAYVVPTSAVGVDRLGLKQRVRRHLPDIYVPSAIVELASLPRTANGKLDRAALPVAEAVALTAPTDRPRNETERKIATIWSQLMERPEVGIRENFFDLGGHSLLAVQLAGRLEQHYGRRIPIAELFRRPTIVEQAAWLHSEPAMPDVWSPIVPLQTAGGQPPIVCVHCIQGRVHHYYDLAQRLGPDQPVYALQPPGLDGTDSTPDSVEALAKRYVAELQKAGLGRPFRLCGFSFGGVVAFELARALEAAGEPVEMVTLFDSVLRPHEPFRERATRHRDALRGASPADLGRYALRAIAGNARYFGRTITARTSAALERAPAGPQPDDAVDRPAGPDELAVRRTLERAERRYRPSPWTGRVLLLRQGADDPWFNLGWSRVAPNLTIERIPGEHGSLLREPHLTATVEKAKAFLDGSR